MTAESQTIDFELSMEGMMNTTTTKASPEFVFRPSPLDDEYFRAGQRVPAGDYQQVETKREVHFEKEDVLPASLDGRVAVYVRRPLSWADISRPRPV
jgi:hypothetical protein